MKHVAAALLVLLAASPALAQKDGDRATDLAAQDCTRARQQNKKCVLTFGEETVEGGIPTGLGESFSARDLASFASLVRIRADFRAEIIRAAEDL